MIHFAILDWIYSILIGLFVVSFWRGTWVLLDIWDCGQPSTASLSKGDTFCFALEASQDPDGPFADVRRKTASLSYGLGVATLAVGVFLIWIDIWNPPKLENTTGTITKIKALLRFLTVYILGVSAALIWRGIWYWCDDWILADDPLASFWTTSLVGSTGAFLLWAGNSLLAPPAIFLLDGPSHSPPPIGVTMLSSHYAVSTPINKRLPDPPVSIAVCDILVSFGVLPFCVVWFWRGTWLLMDHYFWGFTDSDKDVQDSMGWTTMAFLGLYFLANEDIATFLEGRIGDNKVALGLLERLRTWVEALGTVAFWRVIWLVWDEFLGGTSQLSAWGSHIVGVICLLLMGCVSSINAPASTVGIDTLPHPECADEPLFSPVPVPYEVLYFLAIARQPVSDEFDSKELLSTGKDSGANEKKPKPLRPLETEMTSISNTQHPKDSPEELSDVSEAESPESEVATTRPSRSLRPGLGPRTTSFVNVIRHTKRRVSNYAQRPCEENKRNRSKNFRSR